MLVIETIVLIFSPLFLLDFTQHFIPKYYDFLQRSKDNYAEAYNAVCIMIYVMIGKFRTIELSYS